MQAFDRADLALIVGLNNGGLVPCGSHRADLPSL